MLTTKFDVIRRLSVPMAVFAGMAVWAESGMFPFVPSYDSPDNVVNMSHLLDAPAGRHGRIRVKSEHFVNDKGRVKLHATNLTGPANFPTHEEAERLAARLARFGINCVRLHFFDRAYGTFMLPREAGIFTEGEKRPQTIDPVRFERMDYLISEFKKRGIYVNFNLWVARKFEPCDGVPPGAYTAVDQFYHPAIIAKEKAYARELLSHVNPYTGMNYLTDPVVAQVELNNEASMLYYYVKRGALDEERGAYTAYLRRLWNEWLLKTYGNDAAIRKALGKSGIAEDGRGVPIVKSKDKTATIEARRDFHRFIIDTEHGYWTSMRDYLQKDLGLEAPVAGTQLGFSTPYLMAELDYVDHHVYWCHPSVKKDWTIRNKSLVNSLSGGCLTLIANQRVLGKPYTVSEFNQPYPNFYGAESQTLLRALGAFQGWDGVFEYSYNNRQNAEPDHNEYFFSMAARTDVLAHFPACAAMFLRGDVREGVTRVVANMPYKGYFDRLAANGEIAQGIVSATDYGLPQSISLKHPVAVDLSERSAPVDIKAVSPKSKGFVRSDTGELVWDNTIPGAAVWTVDTPNTKLFSGFPKGRTFDLGGVKIAVGETKLGWATVSLVSHGATGFGDGARPARILLAATGLSHNKGAKFTEHGKDRISCRDADWGTGPVMNEGIPAVITLPAPAANTVCRALDERGEPKADLPISADASGRAVVKIGPEYRTVWYEIAVEPFM